MNALAHAWHTRCPQDPVASHPFTHGDMNPQLSDRLAAYMGEALDGPSLFTDTMGDHSGVVRMHSGNGDHPELVERAIELVVLAMDDTGLPADERVRTALLDYFRWATGLMAEYPDSPDGVPSDLPLPHRSWTGPVA